MGGTYHSEIFIFLKLIHVNYLVFFGKLKNFYKLIFLYKISGLVMAKMIFCYIGTIRGLYLVGFIFVFIYLFLSVLTSHKIEKSLQNNFYYLFFFFSRQTTTGQKSTFGKGILNHNPNFFDLNRL